MSGLSERTERWGWNVIQKELGLGGDFLCSSTQGRGYCALCIDHGDQRLPAQVHLSLGTTDCMRAWARCPAVPWVLSHREASG